MTKIHHQICESVTTPTDFGTIPNTGNVFNYGRHLIAFDSAALLLNSIYREEYPPL